MSFTIFNTSIGWIAAAGSTRGISDLLVGYKTKEDLAATLNQKIDREVLAEKLEAKWAKKLQQLFKGYLAGEVVDWTDLPVDLQSRTSFQQAVIAATRAIPHGETRTYGEVALAAGSPKAARAVGTVMSSNRLPIIVPCHRVVASGQLLGGYTSPQGLELKKHLIRIERQHAPQA